MSFWHRPLAGPSLKIGGMGSNHPQGKVSEPVDKGENHSTVVKDPPFSIRVAEFSTGDMLPDSS